MDFGDSDVTVPLLVDSQPQHHDTKPDRQSRWAVTLQASFGSGLIHSPRGISFIICLSIFLWVLSGMVCLVPGLQIAETLFCKRYYGRQQHHPDLSNGPELCKTEIVQSAMAYIFGVTALLDSIFNLITAFPFGVLADRGRRPIYMLGTAGQFLNIIWSLTVFYCDDIFPTELILVGPVFQIIGGGLGTATSILFAIISDVHKAEDRATWYFFFSLSAQAAMFCGPPFAAVLMQQFSPWFPLMLSPIITVVAGLIILLIPETAPGTTTASPTPPTDHSTTTTTEEEAVYNTEDIRTQIQQKGWTSTMSQNILHTLNTAKQTLLSHNIHSSRSTILLLLTFFFLAPLSQAFSQTFFQYISTRYHRSLAEVGYLLALRGGLTLLAAGILLPLASHHLTTTFTIPSFSKDLQLARLSALLTLLSLVGLSLPPLSLPSSSSTSKSSTLQQPLLMASLAFSALGTGLTPLCRSMVSHSTPPDRIAGMFSLVNIVELLGGLPSSMLIAWFFSVGMKLGSGSGSPSNPGAGHGHGDGPGSSGLWAGLPYIYLALCSALGMVALLFMRSPPSSPRGTANVGNGLAGERTGGFALESDDVSRGLQSSAVLVT